MSQGSWATLGGSFWGGVPDLSFHILYRILSLSLFHLSIYRSIHPLIYSSIYLSISIYLYLSVVRFVPLAGFFYTLSPTGFLLTSPIQPPLFKPPTEASKFPQNACPHNNPLLFNLPLKLQSLLNLPPALFKIPPVNPYRSLCLSLSLTILSHPILSHPIPSYPFIRRLTCIRSIEFDLHVKY